MVTTDDLEIETERLVSLGATQTDDSDPQTVVLTDPDGNKFELAVR